MMHASSESWINNLVCYDRTILENMESEGAKKIKILRKSFFKVVQIKS